MKLLTSHEAVIASSLMAGALQAATIQTMIRKNIISNQEGHEIYEQALLMLEASQARPQVHLLEGWGRFVHTHVAHVSGRPVGQPRSAALLALQP